MPTDIAIFTCIISAIVLIVEVVAIILETRPNNRHRYIKKRDFLLMKDHGMLSSGPIEIKHHYIQDASILITKKQ